MCILEFTIEFGLISDKLHNRFLTY